MKNDTMIDDSQQRDMLISMATRGTIGGWPCFFLIAGLLGIVLWAFCDPNFHHKVDMRTKVDIRTLGFILISFFGFVWGHFSQRLDAVVSLLLLFESELKQQSQQ